jgi:hypothetical protein
MTIEHRPRAARVANPARSAAVCGIPAPVRAEWAHCNFAGRGRIEVMEGTAATAVFLTLI